MWEPGEPFYEMHSQLKRADQNVSDVDRQVLQFLFSYGCRIIAEGDPHSPNDLIWRLHVYKEPPEAIPLLAGKAIVDLRSAFNRVTAIVAKSNRTFPTANNFETFIDAIEGLEKRIDAVIDGLRSSDLKANNSGNFSRLRSLYEVDVGDDQRVKVAYNVIPIRTASRRPHTFQKRIRCPLKDREVLFVTPTTVWGDDREVNDEIQPSVEVLFDDLGPFHRKDVHMTLESISQDIFSIAKSLVQFVQ